MKSHKIESIDLRLQPTIWHKIDSKTKPTGSLGQLENIALQIALIQQSLTPVLSRPHILVFASDHGLAKEGVSNYPQEVSWQMVMNFLNGGAAINVFCKQHGIELKVVDAGVNYDFPENARGLVHNKVAKSTANMLIESAMSIEQAHTCIDSAATLVSEISVTGCNIIGFGEMGIGNTSSAALVMSMLTGIPIEQCTGRGTGLGEEAYQHKLDILKRVLVKHGKVNSPLKVLATYGGFEIAQLVGAMLQAAEQKMIILVDGFIATAAFLVAQTMHPEIKEYAIYCHQSHEQGHCLLLDYLKAKPLLSLDMRLGEGTGVAVAYPIIQSAVAFLNEMASFESAKVSGRMN